MTDRNRHLGVLARIALLVAVGDWVTKEVAARAVLHEPLVFTERLRFAVIHNEAGAFGLSAGDYTWQLNLALTLAAIAFMIPVTRELARVDEAAPRALGLIVGGALGNLASLVFSPNGVVDFISIGLGSGSEVVLNVADVAAYIGLAMVMRTAFRIVAELRRTARVSLQPVAVRHFAPVHGVAFADREVPLPVTTEDSPELADIVSVPRPESVRRAEIEDFDAEVRDPKVIDIRTRMAPRPVRRPDPPADLAPGPQA